MFIFIKTIISTLVEDKQFRLALTRLPAAEESRSPGTDVPGDGGHLQTISAK